MLVGANKMERGANNSTLRYLQCMTTALQVDVFALNRNALVCELWP